MTGQNDRMAEIEGRVVASAQGMAPPGWRRIDLHCMATVAVNDVALTVVTGEGKTVPVETVEVVYEDGEVRCRASFTHDDEPHWNSEPSGADVRRELERFPRDDVSEWMRRRLGGPPGPAMVIDEQRASRAGSLGRARSPGCGGRGSSIMLDRTVRVPPCRASPSGRTRSSA